RRAAECGAGHDAAGQRQFMAQVLQSALGPNKDGTMSADHIRVAPNRWLAVARIGWLAFFVIAALALLVALPARWAELTQPTPITAANLKALGWPVTLFAAYSLTTEVIFIAVFLIVGLIIFARRSDNAMALFIALMLVAFGVGNQSIAPTIGALRVYPWGALVSALGGFVAWLTFSQFPYLFPSGRYVPAWVRLPALVWFLICFPYNFAAVDSPLYPLNWPPLLFGPLMLTLYVTFLVSQVYRFARVSTPVERQQTKWVMYALVVVVFGELSVLLISNLSEISAFYYLFSGEPPTPLALYLVLVMQSLARFYFGLLPLAFGFSILRYRLWDIDIIIRRTLVYGVLTVLLGITYLGSIVLLQQLFRGLTGAVQSEIVTILSTLAIAALFNPLRHRVQNLIDRRFYRHKYDATHVLAEFSAAARDEVELEKLTARLLEVVEETMQPAGMSVWLKATERSMIAKGEKLA
ncbi:MAG TPA: hypothetical protein VF478_11320, partial [Anaerolineae bacterium]